MLYSVRLYSPYTLTPFLETIEATNKEEAIKKLTGQTVLDPQGNEFTVEETFIIGAYPSPEVMPRPPYKTADLNSAKPPKWTLGATVVEDAPLPIGAEPVGSPYLKKIIPNALTSLIYEQKIHSKEYPELTFHIQFRRDIFTKFLEEAKRMARDRKISEAVKYIIEHAPGITIRMIADCLGIGYWTAYREVAELAYPTEIQMKELMKELDETATLDKWTTGQKEEVVTIFLKEKPPKAIMRPPLWRGQIPIYPIKRKTEDELLKELERILTLEKYKPTPEEWEQMKQMIRKQTEAWLKQSVEYWLQK